MDNSSPGSRRRRLPGLSRKHRKADEMKLIGGTKRDETSFVDKDVEKEKTYYYIVRSLKMNRGVSLESEPSPLWQGICAVRSMETTRERQYEPPPRTEYAFVGSCEDPE